VANCFAQVLPMINPRGVPNSEPETVQLTLVP